MINFQYCANCNTRLGWELLDNLCSPCYTELIIQPAADLAFESARDWGIVIDKRYRVEVALGLRHPPSQERIVGEPKSNSNRAPGRLATRVVQQKSQDSDDWL